ncbi:MAG: hypothetical protein COB26_04330 [Piscirickettsiaceae bacterium]|nr:MAG: hypothetical protein COB89_04140 [Piscirickettsiaceae bacterium]PCI70221.1 MAG: hypothetical protein COB26_04330 [Piscirickettsiaceae bacterium]
MLNKLLLASITLLLAVTDVMAGFITPVVPPTAIPEPSILALLGLGGAAYAFIAWKNKK